MALRTVQSEATVLKKAREKLGLTQQQTADRAGIRLRQYQRFESGERNLTSSSFNIACGVLETLQIDIPGFRHGDYILSEEFESLSAIREHLENSREIKE